MKKLADLFYRAATENMDKEAIWCDGESKTYAELAELVNRYSNYFFEIGVRYGEHIGILMNNSIESVAVMLAAANIGAALVPVNPTLPVDAVNKAFQCGEAKYVIARKYFFEKYSKDLMMNENNRICMDAEYLNLPSLKNAEKCRSKRVFVEEVRGDEAYIITMTSGSTGSPKPINLTQNNKYNRAMAHISLYHITTEDRILAATPLYHSLAERLVIMPLILGATCVLLPRFTPDLYLKCIREQKVTFTISVAAQLKQVAKLLSDSNYTELETLRCVVSSSMLLEEVIKNELISKLKCEFHEMYGTSETSTITDINITQTPQKKKSVGKCLNEADVKIILEDGTVARYGQKGEIVCQTQLMCDGYYKQPQLFQNSLKDGYFKTGDLGYLDEDGYLYFTGRKKELIITGGINVYPVDIENCILEMDCIDQCAAFALPDEKLGEVVAVAIVVKSNADFQLKQLQFWCAKRLADYQQPRKIFITNEFPRNAMGKVIKSKLREIYLQGEKESNE